MKLRFDANSLRLRLLRSEVEALRSGQRLEESVRLGAGENGTFTYALTGNADVEATRVDYTGREIVVVLTATRVQEWASTELVGVYDQVDFGAGHRLDVIVEKDFACLDRNDAENADTFAHPHAGAAC